MKTNTDVATSPGATRGSRIRVDAPRRLEPSTIAASSSSFGMPMMKPRSVQIANGSRITRWVRTRPAARSSGRTGEHDVEQDDEPGLREHEDPDHEDDEELVAREAVLGERDGRENATTIESTTTAPTTTRLFLTVSQK